MARELIDDGFASSEINVVASNIRGNFKPDDRLQVTDTSHAGRCAVAGGVLGGAAGLGKPDVLDRTVGPMGSIIAAGLLAAALSAPGRGPCWCRPADEFELGVVEDRDAEYYAESVAPGGALVTVRTDDEAADRAVDVMREHGAIDIDKRASMWREKGWRGWDDDAATRPYSLEEIERDREMYNVPGDLIDVATTRPTADYTRNP